MADGPCSLRRVHIASSHSAASIWASGRTLPWTSQRYRGNRHQRDSTAVGGESKERSALAFAEAGTSPLAVSLPHGATDSNSSCPATCLHGGKWNVPTTAPHPPSQSTRGIKAHHP